MLIDFFEWIGAISGLLGAFLLATHSKYSHWGWVAFLAANLAMIAFALGIERYGLFIQQLGFLGTSLFGIYRSKLLSSCFHRARQFVFK
jgi:nicotinamide riboside transporter PnuC